MCRKGNASEKTGRADSDRKIPQNRRKADVFCPAGRAVCCAGGSCRGRVYHFASQEEIPAQGYVLTKDERMECKTEWFNGVQEKIVYRFCADGLQEGDSLQGQFLIVSDYGEYTLPWKVTVRREAAAGIAGKVSTLAGFTELARTDWKTAVQFFTANRLQKSVKKKAKRPGFCTGGCPPDTITDPTSRHFWKKTAASRH